MPVDPVCGLAVPVKSTSPRQVHHGMSFYFCSKECAQKFHAHPSRYAFKPRTLKRGPKSARPKPGKAD